MMSTSEPSSLRENPTGSKVQKHVEVDVEGMDDFTFQQRHGKLNVRALSRINLERVIENVDVSALHSLLENIAFCNIKQRDLEQLSDAMVVKAFRVSQLIIEYLINLQNSIYKELEEARDDCERYKSELENFVLDNQVLADDNDKLKRELRQKRKALATYEYVLTVHGNNSAKELLALQKQNPKNFMYDSRVDACVCGTCGKAFSSEDFLQKHLKKRNHFPIMNVDDENSGAVHNRPRKSSEKGDVIESMKKALEEAITNRDKAITEGINKSREEDRKIFDDQLLRLKEERKQHEERVDAKYKEQIEEQRRAFEKQSALLEAKITMLETDRLTKMQESHSEKLLRLEDEINYLRRENAELLRSDLSLAKDNNVLTSSFSSKVSNVQSNTNANIDESSLSIVYLLERARLKQLERVEKVLITSQLRNAWETLTRTNNEATPDKSEWLNGDLSVQEKSDAEMAVDYNLENDETDTSFPSPPSLSPQKHNYADEKSMSPKILPQEKVDQIVIEYKNALESSVITPDILEGMKNVRDRIRKKIAKAEASYTVKQQPLQYVPNPDKECIRSRYNHNPAEIQHQIDIVEKSVEQELQKLGAGNNEKVLTQDQAEECNILLEDRRSSLGKNTRRAIAAAEMLLDDLAQAYYEPSENNEVDRVLDKVSKTSAANEILDLETNNTDSRRSNPEALPLNEAAYIHSEEGNCTHILTETTLIGGELYPYQKPSNNNSFGETFRKDGDIREEISNVQDLDEGVSVRWAPDDEEEEEIEKFPSEVLSSASEYEEAYDEDASEENAKITESRTDKESRRDSWFITRINKQTREDFNNIAWDAEAKF